MNPETTAKLINQLKLHEGFSPTLYKCSAGYNTIGYGHNCDSHGDIEKFKNRTITRSEAECILLRDLNDTTSNCIKYIKFFSDLSEIQQAVLINMTFNMGISGLLKFKKMLKNFSLGYKTGIAREMLKSKWANQVEREAELAFMILTEEFI